MKRVLLALALALLAVVAADAAMVAVFEGGRRAES